MKMMKKVHIINGPNMGVLHLRPHYGGISLHEIETACRKKASNLNLEVSFFQSDSEADLIRSCHDLYGEKVDALIINAASFTHTSLAIADALRILSIPIIEVHVTNVAASPDLIRHHSFISPVARGVISGFGISSYTAALDVCSDILFHVCLSKN